MKIAPCPLFQVGEFVLHSGGRTRFRIECDAFTGLDWEALAAWATQIIPPFGSVEGVPRGGAPFATALKHYVTAGPLLIVDDVLSTGTCMERWKGDRDAIGLVVFARGRLPGWIKALFVTPDALAPAAPLVAYMTADSRTARSAAFLRTYAARVRDGNAVSWEIPNTVATTLEDIAALLESSGEVDQ